MSIHSRMNETMTIAACQLSVVVAAAVVYGGCHPRDAISPERATAERAAIHHDLKNDTGTLYAAAAKRVKGSHPELKDRAVVCAISSIDIQFASETRATYTVAYACGVGRWQLGRDEPVATPTLKLDLLKESGIWQINGIL
jgi:hypothetical protein